MKAKAGAKPAVQAPLYELIYETLREHLLDGTFPPGLVLGEAGVARAFRSSRIPAGAALQRLHAEGLIRAFDGRGYLPNGSDPDRLVRLELAAAGLRLRPEDASSLKARHRRGRIYPDVEHAIAVCLGYGRFLVNESALAGHYGVSRTVAHEVLTRLDRVGLIQQDTNQRWYAGPLTADRLREHFEMRRLLEPAALGQAMDHLEPALVNANRDRTRRARLHRQSPEDLERLEKDLHVDMVLACPNRQLRDAIQRNLLPLFATHSTFADLRNPSEIAATLAEHLAVFDLILAHKKKQAMAALERHVRDAMEPNIERLKRLGSMPENLHQPFLVQVSGAHQ
jgi:DNA-binding GntR family transcriptional regulator